ncbi:MAG: SCO family protein [Pirellulales bacterium]
MNRKLLAAAAVLFVAGGALLALTASRMKQGPKAESLGAKPDPEWSKVDWITDYHLTERSGRDFDSKELKGQIHVVSFFFASCPGPCERQNRQLSVIHDEFAKRGVKFLSITCDPKRDTPEALSTYAKKFQADADQWLFLTGDMLLLRRVGAEVYGVPLDEQTHVEKFFVYDKEGNLVGKYAWNKADAIAEMRQALEDLLAGRPVKKKAAGAVEEPDIPSKHTAEDDAADETPVEKKAE